MKRIASAGILLLLALLNTDARTQIQQVWVGVDGMT